MSRRVQINLAIPIVQPLLDRLRKEVDALECVNVSASVDDNEPWSRGLLESKSLLELFHPDFSHTGVISVTTHESPTILRACSFLRLQLRQRALSAISDDALETDLEYDQFRGDEREAFMLFAFLATLQEVLIKETPPVRPFEFPLGDTLYPRIKGLFRRGRRSPVMPETSEANLWQVVVLNDPVNLMRYVTTVFIRIFSLSEAIAQHHMREVHELKSSTVWVGSREKAEAYARILRSWHLQAVARGNRS
jgi:ATP-dependent Clp protease adaptor protein ClpS